MTTPFLDFDRLERPGSPNHWLIAPAMTRGVDDEAPVFAISPAQLADHWRTVVSRQPRTQIKAISDDRLQIEAEQRSALFGFVDVISFQAVEHSDGHATFFAFSRSLSGYWDLNVNRKRLRHWVQALTDAIGEERVIR